MMPKSSRSAFGSIEPLEARIAPAVILVGAPNNGASNDQSLDHEYTETNSPFVSLENAGPGDTIANVVGHSPHTFYLKLSAGDVVQRSTAQGVSELVRVTSGTVVAFFQDQPEQDGSFKGEFDEGELTGFSVSAGAGLIFKDNLDGDVVQNLQSGFKMTAGVLAPGNVNDLEFVNGAINGNIITGGSLLLANLDGANHIYAGTAAIGKTFDFFPSIATTGNGTVNAFTPAVGQVGSSIVSVTIGKVIDITAGDGGVSAAGGSIGFINVISDTDGLRMTAGNGGAADASHPNGGAGGILTNIFVSNQENPDTSDNSLISLHAGAGGAAPSGTGGAGGYITTAFVGYRKIGSGSPLPTLNTLHENIDMVAGDGGAGRFGGAGGTLSTIGVTVKTPNLTVAPPGNAKELFFASGNGGASNVSGGVRAGAGGNIAGLSIFNQAPQPLSATAFADVVVDAGEGGATTANAIGGNGGSIGSVTILGSNVTVNAGNGSDGIAGGIGGFLSSISLIQQSGVLAHTATLNAGFGGNGTTYFGGAGGTITSLSIDGDFSSLNINSGNAANGGSSTSYTGGNGGYVTAVELFDSDSRDGVNVLTGNFNLRAGDGGNGALRGGDGGVLLGATISTVDLHTTVTAGNGGNGTTLGAGGLGGSISTINILGDGTAPKTTNFGVQNYPAFATVLAGRGGNGGTNSGNIAPGGLGGSVTKININTAGEGILRAGNGGNGGNGAPGSGGNVIASGVAAGFGDLGDGDLIDDSSATITAGNAGGNGTGVGTGGSIVGLSSVDLTGAFATAGITIQAGNGTHGGGGGVIRFVGYGSSSVSLLPVPTGDILIKAGDGSVDTAGRFAGAGGYINYLTGTVTSGLFTPVGTPPTAHTTRIQAGNGGGSASATAAGGNIAIVDISRAPDDFDPGGDLTITAGNAGGAPVGTAPQYSVGAAGGTIASVSVQDIGDNTIFRSVAAGDGVSGTSVGGAGGSIISLKVLDHDIGVKTGQVYGLNTMGGIFAGVGGTGFNANGKSGIVSDVSADSISSIAAGRSNVPQLAERVEKINLNGIPALPVNRGTSANTSFSLTFGNQTTVGLNGLSTPAEVEAALNNLTTIAAAGGVDVVSSTNASYEVTFRSNGDRAPLTGVRQVNNGHSLLISPDLLVATTTNGSGTAKEVQTVNFPLLRPSNSNGLQVNIASGSSNSQLSLDGDATAAELQAALNGNALINDNIAGNGKDGVTVTLTADNTFSVKFNNAADAANTTLTANQKFQATVNTTVNGNGTTAEKQVVDVTNSGTFTLAFTDTQPTASIGRNAGPAEVQQKLDAIAPGRVTVDPTSGANGIYRLTYNGNGDRPDIIVSETRPLIASQGTTSAPTTTLKYIPDFTFGSDDFAAAHIVGAIADFNELGANVFKFLDTNQDGQFTVGDGSGDVAIDGLIAARFFDQNYPTNFTPQARYVLQSVNGVLAASARFFDYDNLEEPNNTL